MQIIFAADGSSFVGEEFQLRKTSHGPVLYNAGPEAYFNPVKRQWCMSPVVPHAISPPVLGSLV